MTPQASRDLDYACLLIARYERFLDQVDSINPIVSRSAYAALGDVLEHAKALYDTIASNPQRWQEGLSSGAIGGLQPLADFTPSTGETYGVALPDHREEFLARAWRSRQCEP